jgi:hypothetical protein
VSPLRPVIYRLKIDIRWCNSERAYRPGQIFHEVIRGITDQILGLVPSGPGLWYKAYGQLILACVVGKF